MSVLIRRFLKDKSGATVIEYGIIAALISVAIIVGARSSGQSIGDNFDTISDALVEPEGGEE